MVPRAFGARKRKIEGPSPSGVAFRGECVAAVKLVWLVGPADLTAGIPDLHPPDGLGVLNDRATAVGWAICRQPAPAIFEIAYPVEQLHRCIHGLIEATLEPGRRVTLAVIGPAGIASAPARRGLIHRLRHVAQ